MQKKQFPSPEFSRPPTEEELATQRKREKLDRRYDHLLAERKKLFNKLEQYDARDYDIVFFEGTLADKEIRGLADEWLKKVREETELFSLLDRLEIEIFTDDLKKQPGFEDTHIFFESEWVREKSVVSLKGIGGLASRYLPKIEIENPEPSLRDQMHYFFINGSFREAVQLLIHELIHRYHFRKQGYTEIVLSEAQAYAAGLLDSGTQFSLTSIASILTRPEEEGGAYRFDTEEVIEALRIVTGLAALGKKQDEIADLVVNSKYDQHKKMFVPITEEYLKLKEKYNLDENDLQALDDIYRLHANNQRLKARLLLMQTIDDNFSKKELFEKKKQRLRKAIAYPEYWIKGQKVLASNLMQKLVCPVDSEFPYDPKGKRTGIIFGFFQKGQEEPHFEIGRLEAKGRDSTLEFAQTAEQVEEYIDKLSKHFKKMPFDEKKYFFWEYVKFGVEGEPKGIAEKIIKALFDEEEKKKLLLEATLFWRKQFTIIEREVNKLNVFFGKYGSLRPAELKNLDEYEKMVNLDRFEQLLEMKIKEVDKSFDDLVKKIRKTIKKRKAEQQALDKAV